MAHSRLWTASAPFIASTLTIVNGQNLNTILKPLSRACHRFDRTQTNKDGSVNIYFKPKASPGKVSNRVPTHASGKFEVLLRRYGPEKRFFFDALVRRAILTATNRHEEPQEQGPRRGEKATRYAGQPYLEVHGE